MNNTSSLVNKLLHLQKSCDECFYICKASHSKVINNKVPFQAVFNKLSLEWLPKEFRNLRRLETVLVVRRILFKKITVMPKRQSPKVKSSICNSDI